MEVYSMKNKYNKQYGRVQVMFNTGTRIHKPLKGKGSYRRKSKNFGDCGGGS